ncbi:MAG: hypothetical protein ABJP79_00730 [Tateyamaria sp.]|uniref:hypothetical protein n=1 Tax=Tateyamaria sp. TaxID=1929288 RepID=UPI00329CD433
MSNMESFNALLAADKTMQRVFDTLTDRLIAESKHPLTKAQLAGLVSVRLATLVQTDIDADQYAQELSNNFEVFRRDNEEAEQIADLMQANIAKQEAAEAALGLADMDPAKRLAYGREKGLISAKAAPPPQAPTGEKLAQVLAENAALPRSMRISHARANGLT